MQVSKRLKSKANDDNDGYTARAVCGLRSMPHETVWRLGLSVSSTIPRRSSGFAAERRAGERYRSIPHSIAAAAGRSPTTAPQHIAQHQIAFCRKCEQCPIDS